MNNRIKNQDYGTNSFFPLLSAQKRLFGWENDYSDKKTAEILLFIKYYGSQKIQILVIIISFYLFNW